MSQTTLITGVGRRRQFTDEQKRRILEEAFSPGGNAAEVCRREEIYSSLLYRWRRAFGVGPARGSMTFSQAVLAAPGSPRPQGGDPAVMMIEFSTGVRIKVRASTPPALLQAALKALR